LASLNRPPKVGVSGSATGYYGDRGEEILSEDNNSSSDFYLKFVVNGKNATEIAKQAVFLLLLTFVLMLL
jgi:uncharacterized protein